MNELSPGTSVSPERDRSADILRGLAIILVVLGHANRGIMTLSTAAHPVLAATDFVLYSTHMPAFFVAGGYFTHGSLQRRSPTQYLSTRIWDVLYPYLIWSIIFVVTSRVAAQYTEVHKPLPYKLLLTILWRPIHVLWFLNALFILQITALGLRYCPCWIKALALPAVAAAYLLMPTETNDALARPIAYAPFFLLGFILSACRRPLIPRAIGSTLWAAVFASAFGLGCLVALKFDVPHPIMPVTFPISLLGVATLAAVSMVLERRRALKPLSTHIAWIGTLSLPIYLLHVLTLALAPRILRHFNLYSVPLALIVGTIIGVYGSMMLFVALDRLGLAERLGLVPGKPFKTSRMRP